MRYSCVTTLPKWDGKKSLTSFSSLDKARDFKRVMDTLAMGVPEACRRPETWIEDAQGNRIEECEKP